MTDSARGPTTEELRARVLAHESLSTFGASRGSDTEGAAARNSRPTLLPRPCLACNREQGERMCDLCLRLELAERSL